VISSTARIILGIHALAIGRLPGPPMPARGSLFEPVGALLRLRHHTTGPVFGLWCHSESILDARAGRA
jgi:hypothetical protein